jgi:hypothetical protein
LIWKLETARWAIESAGNWVCGWGFLANLICDSLAVESLARDRMQPRERRETGDQDLFRSRLDQIIDMKHPPVTLGRTVDWGVLSANLEPATDR